MKKIFAVVVASLGLLALPAHLQQNAVISNIQAVNVQDTSATIQWQTVVPGTSRVEYGLTDALSQKKVVDESVLGHSVMIGDLRANQLYSYRVESVDPLGNWMTSPVQTFQTGLGALDTLPPAGITDLRVVDQTFGSVTIEWTAPGDDGVLGSATRYDARRADSTVALRSDTWFNQTLVKGVAQPLLGGTRQRMTLSNLLPSEPFFLAIRTLDEANNISAPSNIVAISAEPTSTGSFTISKVRIVNLSSSGVVLQWWTGTPATTELLLGYTTEYEIPIPADTRRTNTHAMIVGGLQSGRTYHFKIQGADSQSGTATTSDIMFTTF